MQRFLITYDLRGTGGEDAYEELIAALEDLGAVRVQKSVWYLKDKKEQHTWTSLRDRLWQHMDTDSRLLVVLFTEFSGKNSITKVSES